MYFFIIEDDDLFEKYNILKVSYSIEKEYDCEPMSIKKKKKCFYRHWKRKKVTKYINDDQQIFSDDSEEE